MEEHLYAKHYSYITEDISLQFRYKIYTSIRPSLLNQTILQEFLLEHFWKREIGYNRMYLC